MKLKLALLLALLPVLAAAAAWDGNHGDLRIVTMSPSVAALPMLPWAGVSVVTEIFVSSSDETVEAFAVTIRHKTPTGEKTQSVIAPIMKRGYMAAAIFLGIDEKDITQVTIGKLHRGEHRDLVPE